MSWKEFFYFQKSDRQVLLVALTVAVVAFGLIFLVGERHTDTDSVPTPADSLGAWSGADYEKQPDEDY